MRVVSLAPGEFVFRAGEPSIAVYVIEHGEIAIQSGDGAAAVDIVRLHDGDLFGESGVLEGRARSASAVARAATSLLVTDGGDFLHAFGVDNDKALSLLRLLCRRLRNTTRRAALAKAELDAASKPAETEQAADSALPAMPIRLIPHSKRLTDQLGPVSVDIRKFPFLVGNRYGGETSPISSARAFCVPAAAAPEFSAPHFEILREAGGFAIRDLSQRMGTIVNGESLYRASAHPLAALRQGENLVIAGDSFSPFRFRVVVGAAA